MSLFTTAFEGQCHYRERKKTLVRGQAKQDHLSIHRYVVLHFLMGTQTAKASGSLDLVSKIAVGIHPVESRLQGWASKRIVIVCPALGSMGIIFQFGILR
ncbi:hypothetical protein TWF173_000360 [Orbilia oligospora]|nr:hypothetical protein TWF173_000360 [Orbilia oligospora]